MRSNTTRYALLGCLSLAPMSGYDVRRMCETVLSHFWHESYGQIYANLRRLEDAGLVTSEREPSERGPERVVYSLMDDGWRELLGWLGEPANAQVPRDEMMLKLFFGPDTGTEHSLEHVRRYATEQRARRDALASAVKRLERAYPDSPYLPYWVLGGRRGIRMAEAALAWCEEAEEVLGGLPDVDLGPASERARQWGPDEGGGEA